MWRRQRKTEQQKIDSNRQKLFHKLAFATSIPCMNTVVITVDSGEREEGGEDTR